MTTTCLPCELAATAEPIDERVPETGGASWSGPIGMEGEATGDGRYIELNALRWDTLPVPLRWVQSDVGAHDGAVVVGKITRIERNEQGHLIGFGDFDLGSDAGREAYRQVKEGLTPGVSMDLDDIVVSEEDDDTFKILEGRVRAATIVAIPAFEGARIAVSDEGSAEFRDYSPEAREEKAEGGEAMPDGSFPISNCQDLKNAIQAIGRAKDPEAAKSHIRGRAAALECEDVTLPETWAAEEFNWVEDAGGLPEYIRDIADSLIKNGFAESRAIAVAVNAVKRWARGGPAREGGSGRVSAKTQAKAAAALAEWEAKKAAAGMGTRATALTASAPVPPREWFQDPGLAEPTGLTVDDDGRVYGHIALWGTCHIANPQGHGVCTQPPSSPSQYAYFRTGMTTTTKGDVPTGKITMSTLHAGPKMSASDAVYHYEHTGSVGADVVAGEDSFGIWVAGAARANADRVALKAAPISGDWRTIGGVLEMVGALSVNIPGFPVPRAQALVAGGAVQSLVASGIVLAEEKTEAVQTLELSDETVLALRERFRDMDRREKAAALAARVEKAIKEERVRRLAASIDPAVKRAFAIRQKRAAILTHLKWERVQRLAATLAYNPDQWRVPKGNGELSGRFIDMPDAAVGALEALMMDVADSGDLDEGVAEQIGDTLGNAVEAAGAATVALRNGDGEAATKWATEADEHLSKMEAQLQDAVDTGGINGPRVEEIGAALDEARTGVSTVKDSDLSLLGDEGIGADDAVDVDAPSASDIGAETTPGDAKVVQSEGASSALFPQDKKPLDDNGFKDIRTEGDGMPVRYEDADGWQIVMDNDGKWDIFEPEEGTAISDIMDEEKYPDAAAAIAARDTLMEEDPSYGEDPLGDADLFGEAGFTQNDEEGKSFTDPRTGANITQSEDGMWQLDDGEGTIVEEFPSAAEAIEYLSEAPDAEEFPEAPEDEPIVIENPPGSEFPEATGSPQQQASTVAKNSSDVLAATIEDAAEGGLPEDKAPAVGAALDNYRDVMDRLNAGIQDGNYNAADLAAARTALSTLEAQLMDAAEGPGLSDEQANSIGVALDAAYADLESLGALLQGDTSPPPFGARLRRRAVLARFTRRKEVV